MILLVEEAILATDLAIYFKNRGETFSLITNGSLSWSNQDHKKLIRGLLMTACDLGAITKPWDIQQKIATLVSDEFFYQGDLEKQELQMSPIPMMDRDYKVTTHIIILSVKSDNILSFRTTLQIQYRYSSCNQRPFW